MAYLVDLLQNATDQAFEIFAFGEGDGNGMIDILVTPFQNLHVAARVNGCAKDDLLKEVGADQAATTKGG